ncbi:Transcriptional regulators, LysR family [plant metagenome]
MSWFRPDPAAMIREFRTFSAVARHGSFAGAGDALGLTQSAVSAQIKRLESFLGMELFDRSARAAVLNPAGQDMLAQAEQVLAQVDRMVSHTGLSSVSGTLRLGSIASVQQGLLVHALRRFRETLPEVRVRVVPGVSLSLLSQADAGEVDLALMIKPPFALPPDLVWRGLLREPIVLAAPERMSLRPWREMAASEPFVRYDKASFGGRLADTVLRRHRIVTQDVVELDEIEAIANMVRVGLGVALLPCSAWMDTRGLQLVSLGEDAVDREIGIVARRDERLERPALEIARCLQAVAASAVAPRAVQVGEA